MKKIRNTVVILFILIFALLIFFIFHVPDSTESRVNKLADEIALYEAIEAENRFINFMLQYENKEKLEIFENLPVSLIKDNRAWLVPAMNKTLHTWVDSTSFNARYLLTELKLEEKRNMRLIKNLNVVTSTKNLHSLPEIAAEIYQLGKEHWAIEEGDFYVLDDSLHAQIKYVEAAYNIEDFKVRLFEIQNSYVFDVEYKDGKMLITPSLEQFEDNGAYELAEKLGFYELERFKLYFEKKYSIQADGVQFKLSDKLLNKPVENKEKKIKQQKNIEYIDVLYNREKIKKLENINDLRYVGSLAINYSLEKEPKKNKKTTDDNKEEFLNQFMINLFKDM